MIGLALIAVASLVGGMPTLNAISENNERVERENAEARRVAEAELKRRQAELRRAMVVRADSVIKALPTKRIRKLSDSEIATAVAYVGHWRADSTAIMWKAAAQKELDRRAIARVDSLKRVREQSERREAARQRAEAARVRASGPPAGATAKCRDGTYSYSGSRRGTCSRHGGVAIWY